ncbi:hypothetical protein K1719_027240 [Acacia pycnantha]|nr:hypothetical protein K1719_027240 [Acacia pycnantha]
MDLFDPSTPLPPWFSEQDLATYASLYEKSGFRYALQVPYRSLAVDCGLTDPKVTCPALLIVVEKDYVLKFPGMEDYTRSGTAKHFVPNLDIIYEPEGSHFVHEQLPEKTWRQRCSLLSCTRTVIDDRFDVAEGTIELN